METTKRGFSMRWGPGVEKAANISVVCIAVVLVWHAFRPTGPTPPTTPGIPAAPLAFEGAHFQGRWDAPVGMILFSDFQCPFSRRFALAILPELAKQYVQTGKLLIAFRQLPNQSIHPLAMRAARATQCAGRQRLFWPMHDFLFAGPGSLDLDPARVQISVRELDQQAFESCIARADDVQIYEDLASARALSVSGTPTFFLGLIVSDAGHPLLKVTDVVSGAKPLALFNGLIDRLISSRYAGGR